MTEYNYKPVQWMTLPKDFEMAPANGIAIDAKGRIYAAAGLKDPILVFSPEGKLLDSWGEGIIQNKHSVRIFNKKVYVCDATGHQVFEFSPEGKLLRAFGTKDKSGTGPNEFYKPTDIAIAANGDIYISDGYGNRRIVCLDPQGKFKFAWGKEGKEPGEFRVPHDIVIDRDQNVYVADRDNLRVQVFDARGKFLRQWKTGGQPFGLEIIPGKQQKLLVTEINPDGPHRLAIYDLKGKQLYSFGSKGKELGQFDVPHSVTIDKDGNLYIAEVGNKRITKLAKQK